MSRTTVAISFSHRTEECSTIFWDFETETSTHVSEESCEAAPILMTTLPVRGGTEARSNFIFGSTSNCFALMFSFGINHVWGMSKF